MRSGKAYPCRKAAPGYANPKETKGRLEQMQRFAFHLYRSTGSSRGGLSVGRSLRQLTHGQCESRGYASLQASRDAPRSGGTLKLSGRRKRRTLHPLRLAVYNLSNAVADKEIASRSFQNICLARGSCCCPGSAHSDLFDDRLLNLSGVLARRGNQMWRRSSGG